MRDDNTVELLCGPACDSKATFSESLKPDRLNAHFAQSDLGAISTWYFSYEPTLGEKILKHAFS